MLVFKLHNALNNWQNSAYNVCKRDECEPNLNDLIEFVDL